MQIIYRKSDLVIGGYVHPNGNPLATELLNVCNSEMGGSVEDYEVVDADPIDASLYKYKINANGSVDTELHAKGARQARLAELKEKGKAFWSEEDRNEILDLLLGS